jgi:hypothetical protein
MLELLVKAYNTRKVIITFLVLLSSWPIFAAEAFRAPPPLARIVGTADVIAIGRITSVCDETFKLRVTEVISARVPFNQLSISIRRSSRSPTDPRWAPYKQGQDVLIFIKREGDVRQWLWSFAGMPNDSEWPVNEELVSIKLSGYQFFAQMLPRSAVISALKGYKSCFSWGEVHPNNLLSPSRICGNEILEAYCIKSVIHRHLAQETLEILNTSPPSECNTRL